MAVTQKLAYKYDTYKASSCQMLYYFLFYKEDYLVWKRKQGIVNAIEKSNYEAAENLLKYYDEAGETDKLGMQFSLVMRAQIMQKQNEAHERIARLCEESSSSQTTASRPRVVVWSYWLRVCR